MLIPLLQPMKAHINKIGSDRKFCGIASELTHTCATECALRVSVTSSSNQEAFLNGFMSPVNLIQEYQAEASRLSVLPHIVANFIIC